jgi:branched-chain amino acid transport system ATP-binding protein
MLLCIENLEVRYGAIKAIQGASLSVDRGEIVALIGANGAGKTTLLRTLSGLLRPTHGTIVWEGNQSLCGLPPHHIVQMGISHAPEGRQIFANMTVRENLLLGAYRQRDKGEILANIERCYGLFSVLASRKHQPAGTLSGGEQQMLAIARALMARPQLLLLDEPSMGLAPQIVRTLFQIIRRLNDEGTTILLVEQNAHMALRTARRGYVLQNGRVVLADAASNLLAHPEVKRAYLGG